MSTDLSRELSFFANTSLEPEERETVRLCLGTAVGEFIDKKTLEPLPDRQNAVRDISGTLNLMNPLGNVIPQSGILFTGRPTFITDELLHSLKEEARLQYRKAIFNY